MLPFSFSLSSPFRFGVCTMEIFLEFFCFARRAEIMMKWDGKKKSDNRMVYHNPCCPSVSRSGTAVHVLFLHLLFFRREACLPSFCVMPPIPLDFDENGLR